MVADLISEFGRSPETELRSEDQDTVHEIILSGHWWSLQTLSSPRLNQLLLVCALREQQPASQDRLHMTRTARAASPARARTGDRRLAVFHDRARLIQKLIFMVGAVRQ